MRRTLSLLITAAVAAVLVGAAPAQAGTDPTTLLVEGTLRVVAVDHFGTDARADHLYSVVTDDGAEIPVDLDREAPANSRFTGELVVTHAITAALDAKNLLPRLGSTIAGDTRAGRVAVAVAEQLTKPLQVVTSAISPVTASAATTPAPHQAYVAVVTNRGSVEETDPQITALVTSMTDYWMTESGGAVSSFAITGPTRFASDTAGQTSSSCGMGDDPSDVWNEAAAKAFPGVSFAQGSRNHLIVAMANECAGSQPGEAGVAGIAEVGTDFSSGGRMSFSMGSIGKQVGVHEMGHTFGLGHANLQRCATCGVSSYGDLFSVMGLAIQVQSGSLDPPVLDTAFRVRLGVADAAEVPVLSAANGPASRSVHLAPRSGTAGARGIDVVDPASGVDYFVEQRSGTGRDARAFYALSSGAVNAIVYRPGLTVTTTGPSGSIVLQSATTGVAALTAGQGYTSPSGAVRITAGAMGATGADVTVEINPVAAPAATAKTLSAKKPTIRGTARVGRTLKVRVGTWSPRPSYRYQWYANGKKITRKATKSSFVLTSKQKGKRITVKVTGRKTGYTTVTKTSSRTKKVANRR